MTVSNRAVGLGTLALGLVIMSSSFWADTTPVGTGFTLGFGAIASIFALWSLVARNPIKDHWSLSVVGLILFIGPWVGQFAGDAAAWTSWIGGALIMVLSGAAYIHDESDDAPQNADGQDRRSEPALTA